MTLDALIRDVFRLPAGEPVLDAHGPGKLPGWDSLGHVNLISALESAYAVSIGIDEAIAIETVADIRALLRRKGVAGFDPSDPA